MTRNSDAGFILINVLVVLGLAAMIVYAMLTQSDVSIARNQRFSEAGHGLALIRGAEQSAMAALRRDMIEAPEFDHAGEAWGGIRQEAIGIAGASIAMQITDAQGLLNLNTFVQGGPEAVDVLSSVLLAAGIAPDIAGRVLASLALDGPLFRLEDLKSRIGMTSEDIAALGALATALPGAGAVNVNAASPELLAVLTNDPVQSDLLVTQRDSKGFLTPGDLEAMGEALPPGTGFQSSLFQLRTTVQLGDTTQSAESLLRRRQGPFGPEAAVIGRRIAIAPAPRLAPSN